MDGGGGGGDGRGEWYLSWEAAQARERARLRAYWAVEEEARVESLHRDYEAALGDFDPIADGRGFARDEFVGRAEYVDARTATLVKEAMIEERLDQHERRLAVLECRKAWLDPLRTRIEALFDKAHRRAGRPPEWEVLRERMREDGVIRDQVRSGPRSTRARVVTELARHYGAARRTLNKALDDL